MRPVVRVGVPWVAGEFSVKRTSCVLLDDWVVVSNSKPCAARRSSEVLAMLDNLTGERDRALEGVVFDWYVFAGDRDRMLGAAFSLSVFFSWPALWPACLSLPRENDSNDSSLSSVDSLVW